MSGDEIRERYSGIFAAVRAKTISVDLDLMRYIVHWLGDYARLKERPGQPGAPEGLIPAQIALAEAVAVMSDSRQREQDGLGAAELVAFEHEQCMGTAEAADLLGISADTVRWHCRAGNLEFRRVGRQLMIPVSSIERWKVQLSEWKGA